LKLCGQFLKQNEQDGETKFGGETELTSGIIPGQGASGMSPINESPQTQMNHVYSMMWPNVPALEADVVMQDDAWMEFLRGEDPNFNEYKYS